MRKKYHGEYNIGFQVRQANILWTLCVIFIPIFNGENYNEGKPMISGARHEKKR